MGMRSRFCLVSHDPYHPVKGGGCLRFRKLADFLSERHEVHFVGPSERTKSAKVAIHPFRLFSVSMFKKTKAIRYGLFTVFLIPILVYICRTHKVNVLVAHNADAGFASVVPMRVSCQFH